MEIEFDASLWLWDARRTDSWTFLSLPEDLADEVLERGAPAKRGFGSLRVEVRLGGSTWQTSIFPDNARKTYVLPVKKAIRRAEAVEAGDVVGVRIRLLDAE